MIPKQFFQELAEHDFSRIIISVSGGVDSTAIALNFYFEGMPDCELLWNNTLRSMFTARENLALLFKFTGFPFNIVYPQHPQKLITEKTRKVLQQIINKERPYRHSDIACCYYLKEYPLIKFLRENTSHDTVIISGIAGYESQHRQAHLGVLRKRNTFFRFKKKQKRWFGYPLRDYKSRSLRSHLVHYIEQFGYHTKASGCHTCPVVALFPESEPDFSRRIRSRVVWLNEKCPQTKLEKYL